MGGSWQERHLLEPVDRFHLDFSSKNGFCDRDLVFTADVVAISGELLVRQELDLEDEIASAAVKSLVAALSYSEKHTVVNALGNLNGELDFLLEDSVTLAGFTLDRVDTCSKAGGTNVGHAGSGVARALAAGADQVVGLLLDFGSLAGGADDNSLVLDVGESARYRLRKINLLLQYDVATANLSDTKRRGVLGRLTRI